jgi:hypothetical protein
MPALLLTRLHLPHVLQRLQVRLPFLQRLLL